MDLETTFLWSQNPIRVVRSLSKTPRSDPFINYSPCCIRSATRIDEPLAD